MAKTSILTGVTDQPVHGRTTGGSEKAQVVVLGTDGTDDVTNPADLATTAKQDLAKAVLDSILAALDGVEGLLTADAITAAVRDRIGEVQTTPTANTVLSRLKAINDTIAAGGPIALEATLQEVLTALEGTLSITSDLPNGLPVDVSNAGIGFLAAHPVDSAGATATIKTADLNATADGDNSVIAAVASKKLWILSTMGAATGAGLITFKDGSTVKKRFRAAAAGDGFVHDGGLDAPFIVGSTNTAFQVNVPAGVDFEGGVTYIELP